MPKIFIIDDDSDLLLTMKLWCEKQNYEVATYVNANNLLEKAQSERPDIILLDINLAGKDGRSICYNLKHDVSFPLKIILFSADPIALLHYHEHYADGILNKPFEFKDLDIKLKQHLRLSK